MSKFIIFAGIGLELGALMAGALYLAHLLDAWYSVGPLAALVACLVALVLWFTHTIILLKKLSTNSNDNNS